MRTLPMHGFRPVWTDWDGYPGEIPPDIGEYLNEQGQSGMAQMIGPLRSIAWLAGLDELVEAIDHSAYLIEDQIELFPHGAGLSHPVNRHWEEGRIPPRVWDKIAETSFSRTGTTWNNGVILHPEIPAGVSETPTPFNLRDLYGATRISASRGTVKCMRVRYVTDPDLFETTIRRQAGRILASDKLWFRGTCLRALESTLYFFAPQIPSHNADNEFGPGYYTTNSFQYALGYASAEGVVLVFKDPDLRSNRLWQPSPQEWDAWVARWLPRRLAVAGHRPPSQSLTADFIQGAISRRRPQGGPIPVQGEHQQLVASSHKGCQALSKCLELIIFVERR